MCEDRADRLCLKVIRQSRHRLYFELRFLEQAIFHLTPEENAAVFFGSDGEKIYYERMYLLKRYLQSPETLCCDHLHTVIHCLYQHPFQTYRQERKFWDLASDIAAADVFGEISVPWIAGQISKECLDITGLIKKEVPVMSASHIAAYLQDWFSREDTLAGYPYTDLAQLFQRDCHDCWGNRREEEKQTGRASPERQTVGKKETDETSPERQTDDEEKTGGISPERQTDDEEKTGGISPERQTDDEKQADETSPEPPTDGKGLTYRIRSAAQLRELSESWKKTAESAILNADSFFKERGKIPGSMRKSIQRLTREQYDYTEFLKKFAVMNERMKLDLDEFDHTYYLYGLKILGKIPLLEPLEYKEEKQIREFAVVIDTSGSCSEKLTQLFLNKTYNILCQTDSFADRLVLHIIQCDAWVQEDIRIDSRRHMEEYISKMVIRGGGGTDFRPAFTYVENLCKKGEFKRLGGLIYFTDGYGIFPERPPAYKTAFVFAERDDAVRVPPWAICLYLDNLEELQES